MEEHRMITDTVTIDSFIRVNRIRMDAERTDSNPNMDDSAHMDHWKCVLKMGYKRMTVYFSQGYGHNGREPKVADVLDCLASDAAGVENARSFEDWCSEYGYDTDSRKAEKTFKVCEHQAKRLENFLGGEHLFKRLMYSTERQ